MIRRADNGQRTVGDELPIHPRRPSPFRRSGHVRRPARPGPAAAAPSPALAAALVAAACLATPLGAQSEEGGEDSASLFSETVRVNVVNVEVYVTDKDGNRVTGLSRDDFEIYEDKKPVAITNFYAVDDGEVVAGAVPPPPEPEVDEDAPPPLTLGGGEEPEWVPEEQRLHLVVYIDNWNIRPFNRNRVFRRIRGFLRQHIDRQDQVMLVSYDRTLNVRRSFTNDPEAINAALYDLETVSGHAVHQDSDFRDMLEAIDEAEDYTDVSMRLRSYAESTMNDLLFTLDALNQITEWLAGLPGRKAILYVSDGLPMVPGQELFVAMQQKWTQFSSLGELSNFDASRRFQQLAAVANTNRVSFYTLDAAGLRVYSSSSVEHFGLTTPGLSSFVDSMQIRNLQSTLQFMAEETGGLAIINTNDPKDMLEKVATDFDTYYSLGYSPAHDGDGRYHRIEVKVKDKKLRVRHREGYRDKSIESRMADGAQTALRFGYESNPMGVGLTFGEATPDDDGNWQVPIVVQIPFDEIVLLPQRDFHEARLRLFITALDEKGREAPVQEQAVPIRIPSDRIDEVAGATYRYELSLLMRGGQHRVAIGVRDDFGAESSFVQRSHWVGS